MGRGQRSAALKRPLPRLFDSPARQNSSTVSAELEGSLAGTGRAKRPSDEVIREAWERSGHSIAETARLLGREGKSGKHVVRSWLIDAGCHEPKPQELKVTQEQAVEAIRRHGGGRGAVKLAAAEFGVSSAAISYHLTNADENVILPRPSNEELDAAWWNGGETPTGAASEGSGRPRSTFRASSR